jgi:hypothetical protein
MIRYQVTITGIQPMLHHADSIEWADVMDEWKNNKDNKKGSKAGDDRSPAWRWLGSLYHDKTHIIIPTENVMRCLMEGGAMVPIPGGKNGKTFKSQTQSGIQPTAIGWPLLIGGEPIPVAKILKLNGEKDFAKHKQVAIDHGFSLFLKRAKIGQSKHVRVRPRFEKWGAIGQLVVTDEQITDSALQDIVEMSGQYKGLGDWRPGAKTPGPYGMFKAQVKRI